MAETPAEPTAPDRLELAAGFPAVTAQEWTALVDGVLRKSKRIGADAPEGAGVAKLVRTDLDGIAVCPLYTAADGPELPTGVPGAAPFVRGATPDGPVPDGWDVRQRHVAPDDPAGGNGAVLADLENGVTSVWLAGVAPADLPRVLDGVLLDLAPVVLDAGAGDQSALATAFLDLAADRDVAPGELRGTLGLDPLARRARTGDGPDVDTVLPLARRVAEAHPHVRAVVVDGLPVHAAGGSDGQELGWLLSAGVAYLRALTGDGTELATAARLLEFRIAATTRQFPTIAKLRAARRLWARVTEACGQAHPMLQHAVASPQMLTRRDPYVNLLRGTVAGFAAGVGGADAVTVAPFDAALGASQPFSRRIARNTQTLLVEEAHLARQLDPAGGSWYVESLTAELARVAWAFFQELEAAGGARAALDSGLLAERTAAVRAERELAAATRSAPITGVSEFPDLDEKRVERDPVPDEPGGGLPLFRPAAAYEELRDRSDARLAEHGARPTAFLATLGPLAAYTARAGFARNLCQAGGVAPVEAGPTETVDDVVAAYREADTPVAVLCSTDALYAERAADTAAALHAAGATRVLLAGKGGFDGVDGTIHAGCDALAALESIHEEVSR